jgi:hypothetical protein
MTAVMTRVMLSKVNSRESGDNINNCYNYLAHGGDHEQTRHVSRQS